MEVKIPKEAKITDITLCSDAVEGISADIRINISGYTCNDPVIIESIIEQFMRIFNNQ